MKSRTRRLVIVALAITFLAALLIATDFYARYVLLRDAPMTVGQFRFSRPAAYDRSPYWSLNFAYDQAAFTASWRLSDEGFWASDYHSARFNHSGLIRATVGANKDAPYAVYMLGSSVILNMEVPDQYTIASFLQARVGPHYQVVNLGESGMDTTQQVRLLKTLRLRRGDIVLLFGGLVDGVHGAVGKQSTRDTTALGWLCNRLSGLNRLGTVALLCDVADRDLTLPAQSPDLDARAVRFRTAIAAARAYSIAHGAAFWNFLEPTIWIGSPTNDYERSLLANYNIVQPELTAMYRLTLPTLRTVTRETGGVDLTHAVDALRTKAFSPYMDYAHMTESGNERFAQAIYDQLSIY